MKVTEATGRGTKALYYDISTDSGTLLGSACVNFYPLGDDDEVTIKDARKNAILWAAAHDLLEALQLAKKEINACYQLLDIDNKDRGYGQGGVLSKADAAINKAKGL